MSITTERQAKQRVVDIVKQVKADLHLTEALCYSGPDNAIAGGLGILVREREDIDGDGQYFPALPPRFPMPQIVMNSSITDPDRRNFTFYHELMHHLIRADGELYSFLHEFMDSEESLTLAIERYCNMGAAEFLVPAEDVRHAIAHEGFSVTLIESLARKFAASKPAIAIQLAHCARHECYVVVAEHGSRPRAKARQYQAFLAEANAPERPCLHTIYTACSNTPYVSRFRIGRHVRIPPTHLIAQTFENGGLLKGYDTIPFVSGTVWRCACEAFFHKGKVYAAFNVTAPTPTEQMSMF